MNSHPQLILASGSATRQRLLANAGVPFKTIAAQVDERALEAAIPTAQPGEIAQSLAKAKALVISRQEPAHFVLGADQVLATPDRVFHKPQTIAQAEAQLTALRGKTHTLYTAISIARNSTVLEQHLTTANLTMRAFSDTFLANYLASQPESVWNSPGCYHYEGEGIQLFDKIDGDMHSILGLPMLPLLNFLRSNNLVPA